MKYAIFESGGKQYKAVEGEPVEVDRLPDEAGSKLKIDKVLLLVDGEKINIGTPYISGSTIQATVAEHFKGPKLIVFKYRPRKRIRVKSGHRQTYTRLMIDQIGSTKAKKAEAKKTGKEDKPEGIQTAEAAATNKKPAKTETKPDAKKQTASTVEKKPVVKKTTKPATKKTTAKAAKKPAAKKTAAKKTTKKAASKTAAKTEKKPAAKKTAAKTEKK